MQSKTTHTPALSVSKCKCKYKPILIQYIKRNNNKTKYSFFLQQDVCSTSRAPALVPGVRNNIIKLTTIPPTFHSANRQFNAWDTKNKYK